MWLGNRVILGNISPVLSSLRNQIGGKNISSFPMSLNEFCGLVSPLLQLDRLRSLNSGEFQDNQNVRLHFVL